MTRSGIFACLFFALAVALPFQPWAESRGGTWRFEATVESDESGLAALYFDVGRGFNEGDSALFPVTAGHPVLLRFALPGGHLRALRLVPLDRDVRMTVDGAQIVDRAGGIRARFGPGQFHAANQIESLDVTDGKLHITTRPDAYDPQVTIDLPQPVDLPRTSGWTGIAAVFIALLAICFFADWALRSPKMRLRERARAGWIAANVRPGRSIAVVAFVVTLVANYPVVFLGKSLVSPNLSTALLYGKNPWLPGFQSIERGNSNSADIDALMWQHVPYSMIQHRALFVDGELPLWNRYNSTGTPLLGQGQSSFGDPLHMIPILANGAAWAWDVKLLVAKWLLACGIGFCVWRFTRSLPVSLLMAASAQFIGFFVYRVSHPAVFSFCYSPWILYFWLRIVDARSARASILWMAALLGANLTELTSGTVKEAYMLLLGLNFSGVCVLLASERPLIAKTRLLGLLAIQGVIFAMIGSPVWLTFFRALKNAYTTYDATQAFQIPPGMFIGLFDELFYRPFQIFLNVVNPSANFLVLIGVLWALVRWRSVLMCRYVVALALSSLPALVLVFGVVSPGVIARIPFLGNIMHIDNTFSCVLIVLFLVLAGVGWKQAWDNLGSADGKRDAGMVLFLLVALYAVYLGNAQAVSRGAHSSQSWGMIIKLGTFAHLYGFSLLAASALLMGVIHRARSRGSWTPALVLFGILALATLHWRSGLQFGTAFPDYVIMPAGRVNLSADSPSIDSISVRGDSPVRDIGFQDNFFPGWTAAYNIEGICGPDALMNRYYREFMDASGMERLWDWRLRLQDGDLKTVKPVLDLLDVRFYLDYPAGRRRPTRVLTAFSSFDMEAYESPSSWPRAFFTDSAAVYGELSQYMSWIKAGDGRPFAAIQHSDWDRLSPVPRISGDLTARQIKPAENYTLTTNTTSFTVSATGPGFIVLTEAYEKDNFRATLNGKDVPYLRINHAFKGIYVDSPGTYRVKFSYWPHGLSTTLFIFGIGSVLELAAILTAVLALKPAQDSWTAEI